MKDQKTPTNPDDTVKACARAEKMQQEPLLDQATQISEEEQGHPLPVMGELYNEYSDSDPNDSFLQSPECPED